MAHDPKKCSDPRAAQKFLFTSSYWECPACDAPRQIQEEEKTDPGFFSRAGSAPSGNFTVYKTTGSTGVSLPAGHYVCRACGDKDFYVIDAVANGQSCSCGGVLQLLP